MKNYPAYKTLGLTFGLSILAGTAIADKQADNLFLPSYSPAETITIAYKGKPPYRNRHQVLAQLRAQEAARSKTENLEKTELSAMEIGENADETPNTSKTPKKTYGHPYHR